MAQGGRWHAVPLGSAGGEAGWPPGPRTQMHQPLCCPPHREPRLCSCGRRPRGQRAPLHDSGLRPGPGPAAHGGPRGTWLHLPGTWGQIAPAPTRPASQTPAPRWCSGRGPVPVAFVCWSPGLTDRWARGLGAHTAVKRGKPAMWTPWARAHAAGSRGQGGLAVARLTCGGYVFSGPCTLTPQAPPSCVPAPLHQRAVGNISSRLQLPF